MEDKSAHLPDGMASAAATPPKGMPVQDVQQPVSEDTPMMEPEAENRPRVPWSFTPYTVVLLTSMAIMIIELLAGRLIGRHLGGSLYTWTSIIGVIMAGMSLGNYWGGRLADRHAPSRLLPWLVQLSAATCLVSLGLNYLLAEVMPLPIAHWPLRILMSVLIIFTLPAVALGTIVPVAAKMAVQQARRVGGAVGTIYSLSALGSIFGTFLTGFYLVMVVGVTELMLWTMGGLLLLGLVLYLRRGPEVDLEDEDLVAEEPESEVVDDGEPVPWWWRIEPQAIVFCSAASLMAMEIVAGRLIARHLGSSLYTWTSIIGVVLAGMTLGYFVGGWIADRWSPERYLGKFCTVASMMCLLALMLNQYFETEVVLKGMLWPLRVLTTVTICFLLPSIVLGTISPGAAKLALNRSKQVGTTIGAVYAWGTVGSIVGTLATGFFLISWLGANGVVLAATVLLALLGWLIGRQKWVNLIWVVMLAPMILCAVLPKEQVNPGIRKLAERVGLRFDKGDRFFAKEGNYQYVKVYTYDEKKTIRKLVLDHLVHGYVDMTNPAHLEYDYEDVYADVTLRYAEGKKTVSAFFLGGGSFTFPRWTQVQWPDAHIEVAEIDPVVVEANHAALGLPRDTNIVIHIGDARNTIDSLPKDAKFDFFFGDAFNDFSVPWHLTTVEFNRKIAEHMTEDGAYLMNVIDDYTSGYFIGSCYMTLKQVFPHVYVFCTEQTGVSDRRDTFVVAASFKPLETSDWLPDHMETFNGSVLTEENLAELERKCGGRVLTDELAPVENLLEPIVRTRTN